MRHTLPKNVISPQIHVSNINVIFDGGVAPPNCFSVAELDWDGEKRIAIRWNVSENEWHDVAKQNNKVLCKGMPVSRGFPVWFIMPDVLCEDGSDMMKKIKDLKKKVNQG